MRVSALVMIGVLATVAGASTDQPSTTTTTTTTKHDGPAHSTVLTTPTSATTPPSTTPWSKARGMAAEESLRQRLLAGYDKDQLPEPNTTVVLDAISLVGLDVDEAGHAVTLHVWLAQSWEDPRLVWSLVDNEDVGLLAVDPEDVWTPDLAVFNAPSSTHHLLETEVPTLVYPDGTVTFTSPYDLRLACTLDLTYWPHDRHHCTLRLGSWLHKGHQIDLRLMGNETQLDHLDLGPLPLPLSLKKERAIERSLAGDEAVREWRGVAASEWRVVRSWGARVEEVFPCCREPAVLLRIDLLLERDAPAFQWSVKMPAACLSVLTLVLFLLPPAAGEKITFGGLCLVLDVLFLAYTSYVIGHSPTHTPLVVVMICQQFIVVAAGVVLSALVLRAVRHPHPHPPPAILKAPTLALSYFLCLDSYRTRVGGPYLGLHYKPDEVELGEGVVDEGRGRGGAGAEWTLLGATLHRMCLFVYVCVCVVSLLRFSAVL